MSDGKLSKRTHEEDDDGDEERQTPAHDVRQTAVQRREGSRAE